MKKKNLCDILIGEKPLDENSTYKISLPEFIANGGDRYPKIKFKKYGFVDHQVLKAFVQNAQEISIENFKVQNNLVIQ
jgi:5'-nucleotidase/UDP-sugar diphosphatase